MKFFVCLMFVVSGLIPSSLRGAESAHVRFWCLSLRFQEASDSFGDTLDLSTIAGTPNGELAPYNGLEYISAFSLDISGQPVTGTAYLNLPPFADANGNGFNDFFESAVGVSGSSTGNYTTVLENGTITATWSRAAGSTDGTCSMDLVDSIYGDLGQFQGTFSILEYSGPLLFTPGSNIVSGSINLTNTSDSSSLLQGPVQFVKVSTNRYNQLILQPGVWTNSASQLLTYTNALFARVLPWTTNYYGIIQFADGDPNTPAPDYLYWILSIDDTNDANHNGIPDFSDDPQSTLPPPPVAPSIGLTWSPTNVVITISGSVGHAHDVQQSFIMPASNWETVASVTLTNSLELVPIPTPPGPTAFWRVVAH